MQLRTSFNSPHAVAIATVAALAGCTSGNSAIEPPFQSANIATLGKLQFVVGTANIATGAVPASFVGLNTVVTFRQANGGSAFAVNTPQIVGPTGFKVPAVSSAGSDGGTNSINSTPQGTAPASPPTFDTTNQATLYGFGPNNYDTSGSANFGDYGLPIYADELPAGFPQVTFYGLPPAFPASGISGFPGYNPGFVYFAAQAVSGAYSLNVVIPTSAGSSQSAYTYHASASLNAANVLGALASPTFNDDGKGGGSIVVPPFPAGVTSELVQLTDDNTGASTTFDVAAAASETIPDATLAPGDPYTIAAVGFDYNWFTPAAPANAQQTPTLPAQADITVAFPNQNTALGASAHARRVIHTKSARRHTIVP